MFLFIKFVMSIFNIKHIKTNIYIVLFIIFILSLIRKFLLK